MPLDTEQLMSRLMTAQQSFEFLWVFLEELVHERIRRYPNLTQEEDDVAEAIRRNLARAICLYDPSRGTNPFSWLVTVIDHSIIDYGRRHRDVFTRPQHAESAEQTHERNQAHEILMEALTKMSSSRHREMLLLFCFFPDRSYETIAKIMGLTNADAAKQLKYHALKEMRTILVEMECGFEMFGAMFKE